MRLTTSSKPVASGRRRPRVLPHPEADDGRGGRGWKAASAARLRPDGAEYTRPAPERKRATYAASVRTVWLVGGALLAIAGLVFVLQGLDVDFAPKSGMTGDPLWVVLGSLAVVCGLALVVANRRP